MNEGVFDLARKISLNNIFANEFAKAIIASRCIGLTDKWNHMTGTSYTTNVYSPTINISRFDNVTDLSRLAEVLAEEWVSAINNIFSKLTRMGSTDYLHSTVPQGIFYGVEISAKALSLALGYTMNLTEYREVLGNASLDDHNMEECHSMSAIISKMCSFTVTPETLAMADTTNIRSHNNKVAFPPADANEKLAELLEETNEHLSRLNSIPKVRLMVCGDSDSPYRRNSAIKRSLFDPIITTPGCTLLGSTGITEAIKVPQIYRIAMIGQLVRGNSYSSNLLNYVRPFTFIGTDLYGYRGVDLTKLNELGKCRYSGLLNMQHEYELFKNDLDQVSFGEP